MTMINLVMDRKRYCTINILFGSILKILKNQMLLFIIYIYSEILHMEKNETYLNAYFFLK